MRVAHLVNQYPKISHSFIRREIAGLEALGVSVDRFSIRGCREALRDPADVAELARTFVLLASWWRLVVDSLIVAVVRPGCFARALWTTIGAGWRSDRGLLRHLGYLGEACVLLREVERRRVAHVHAHFATNSAMVALLCRMLGGPAYSFTAHGPDDFERAEWLFLERKIQEAAFVTSVSEYGRRELQRWSAAEDAGKIQVVRMGLDRRFLELKPSGVPDVRRLVSVGRLEAQKGQVVLLDAMADLKQKGIRCELVLVGEGPLREELERRIMQLGLGDVVRMTGALSSEGIGREMGLSRGLVLSSWSENLPVVIMEAFALGRPVVATDVGAVAELVEAGKCGWLVTAGDAGGLARAIEEMLESPVELLERMGAEGRRRVEARHDAVRCAGELLSCIAAGGGR